MHPLSRSDVIISGSSIHQSFKEVNRVGLEAATLYYRSEEPVEPSKENVTQPKERMARREVIKIIAVGGGGGNALNHIISKGLEGVELLAVNTDVRSLEMSLSSKKIVLGEKITKGLGAGALPEIGELSAKESIAEIREYLKGADMVYLAAGMGGGTGTGALPIIAAAAKEMGILTVAVVTKPFSFEGPRRRRYAEDGIKKLRSCVDALIVVPNDRLLEICRKDTPLSESFSMADEVLRQAVQGVTDLVTRPGLVNVDFADLKAVMKQAGSAVMGVGKASGEDRISKALKQALESPLMECSMRGAKGVLMNVTCGEDLGLYEIQQAAAYIEKIISEDATFVWGCVEDGSLDGGVEIVIVATGFDDDAAEVSASQAKARAQAPSVSVTDRAMVNAAPLERAETRQRVTDEDELVWQETAAQQPKTYSPAWLRESGAARQASQDFDSQLKSQQDMYDVPTYVRRSKKPKSLDLA
jgi:cell division protein FtsZ